MIVTSVQKRPMILPNLPNGLTLSRIFLVPILVVVLSDPHRALGAHRSGDLRGRGAHRLARRLPRPAPETGHDARDHAGPGRGQAPRVRGLHQHGGARTRSGVDGGRHRRPGIRGDGTSDGRDRRRGSPSRRARWGRERWRRRSRRSFSSSWARSSWDRSRSWAR